jgi:hypothetical protein
VEKFGVDQRAVQERWYSIANGFHLEVEYEASYRHGNLFDHIRTLFVLNLVELSTLNEFVQEMTCLLMNNCLNHITSYVICLFRESLI